MAHKLALVGIGKIARDQHNSTAGGRIKQTDRDIVRSV
jgi:hypothetical protein